MTDHTDPGCAKAEAFSALENSRTTSEAKIAPEDTEKLHENVECMGCKLVACTTPLVISGYLIHQHSTTAKVAAMPIAATWTGSRRWRIHYHRFNMLFTAPLGTPSLLRISCYCSDN